MPTGAWLLVAGLVLLVGGSLVDARRPPWDALRWRGVEVWWATMLVGMAAAFVGAVTLIVYYLAAMAAVWRVCA